MLKAATKILIGLSLVIALTGPLTFYEGGWGLLARSAVIQIVMFAVAAASPLLNWMGVARIPQSFNERVMAGIAYVLTSYLISVLSQLNSFLGYVDYALQLGLLAGVFIGPRPWLTLLNSYRKRLVIGVVGILLIAGATANGWSALRWRAVLVLPVSILGFSLGERLGNWVRSWALALAEIWGYVKSMGAPIGAFALGYLVLTYVFATIFAAVWRADPTALKGISDHPRISDFTYYSVITISTVGYGDVYPSSPTAKLLAAIEILSGTAWTLVVFAAVITLVQQRLERRSRFGESATSKSENDNCEIQ